jgi:hypothetical protein
LQVIDWGLHVAHTLDTLGFFLSQVHSLLFAHTYSKLSNYKTQELWWAAFITKYICNHPVGHLFPSGRTPLKRETVSNAHQKQFDKQTTEGNMLLCAYTALVPLVLIDHAWEVSNSTTKMFMAFAKQVANFGSANLHLASCNRATCNTTLGIARALGGPNTVSTISKLFCHPGIWRPYTGAW